MKTTCHACSQPVRRSDAVLRGDGRSQFAFHPACFQVGRAVEAVFTELEAARDQRVGLSLSERLAQARGAR